MIFLFFHLFTSFFITYLKNIKMSNTKERFWESIFQCLFSDITSTKEYVHFHSVMFDDFSLKCISYLSTTVVWCSVTCSVFKNKSLNSKMIFWYLQISLSPTRGYYILTKIFDSIYIDIDSYDKCYRDGIFFPYHTALVE